MDVISNGFSRRKHVSFIRTHINLPGEAKCIRTSKFPGEKARTHTIFPGEKNTMRTDQIFQKSFLKNFNPLRPGGYFHPPNRGVKH